MCCVSCVKCYVLCIMCYVYVICVMCMWHVLSCNVLCMRCVTCYLLCVYCACVYAWSVHVCVFVRVCACASVCTRVWVFVGASVCMSVRVISPVYHSNCVTLRDNIMHADYHVHDGRGKVCLCVRERARFYKNAMSVCALKMCVYVFVCMCVGVCQTYLYELTRLDTLVCHSRAWSFWRAPYHQVRAWNFGEISVREKEGKEKDIDRKETGVPNWLHCKPHATFSGTNCLPYNCYVRQKHISWVSLGCGLCVGRGMNLYF